MDIYDFLPVSRADMQNRDWYYYDFLIISGDAYIDHPSFGAAVIGRVLENAGYRPAILAQPGWRGAADLLQMGRPRYAVLITAGNLDSMAAHYTAAKKPRSEDYYSPGKQAGMRPDRAVLVYSTLAKQAFPGLPVIIGGLEASLRRFAHYDYWDNKVRRPVLFDAKADLLVYGMGERAVTEIARCLARGADISGITDIRGTGYIAQSEKTCAFDYVTCAPYETVKDNKRAYAEAVMVQYNEHDPVRGRAVVQSCAGRVLIINPPAPPLSTAELDKIYALPYTREVHPMYNDKGGVPAIDEVRFSITHTRGCFGGCNFCALAFHQGRMVTSRSHESVIREARELTKRPDFKGYIHDIGGPTANFRHPSCTQQRERGMCKDKNCLTPKPCKNLDTSHTDYMLLLGKIAALPGVKKVFIRSGIRFDYLMLDKNGEFFTRLIKHHISGQLKVAPEHCDDTVLFYMNKPGHEIYDRFAQKFAQLNKRCGKDQYLVPYLMSSHPGSTLKSAVRLAEYLNSICRHPEQVQDFYPTPGTISACMYHTGLDPRTMREVYIPKDAREKAMQRALLQWKNPANRKLCREALLKAGRGDLIGYGKRCLIPPQWRKK